MKIYVYMQFMGKMTMDFVRLLEANDRRAL